MESRLDRHYRHEYKYTADRVMLEKVRMRMKGLLQTDANAGESGKYEIRSVYFDDIDDVCYMKNLAGTNPRVKYRIRCYNGSDEYIRLEKKEKRNGMTAKTGCGLSSDEAKALIAGEVPKSIRRNLSERPAVLQELVFYMQTRLFLPKILLPINLQRPSFRI